MKSIAEQICQTQDLLIASGKFTIETLKESMKDCVNEEHRLSTLKSLAKKHTIAESVTITESRRVTRNNGSGGNFTENSTSDLAKDAKAFARSYGVPVVEAVLHLTSNHRAFADCYTSDAELREGWDPFKSILSESEINSLVASKVPPPQK